MDANTATVVDTLVPIILQALPSLIAAVQAWHGAAHPDQATPSEASVIAALQAAAAASLAKDDAWLKAHPVVTDVTGTLPAVD